jgi:plasmid stabilization system protein ParE
MRLELHPLADADISRIIDHYEAAGGAELADEFYSELRVFLKKAAQTPEAYAIRERDIRRILIDSHFIFSIGSWASAFVYWQSATIADAPRLAPIVVSFDPRAL